MTVWFDRLMSTASHEITANPKGTGRLVPRSPNPGRAEHGTTEMSGKVAGQGRPPRDRGRWRRFGAVVQRCDEFGDSLTWRAAQLERIRTKSKQTARLSRRDAYTLGRIERSLQKEVDSLTVMGSLFALDTVDELADVAALFDGAATQAARLDARCGVLRTLMSTTARRLAHASGSDPQRPGLEWRALVLADLMRLNGLDNPDATVITELRAARVSAGAVDVRYTPPPPFTAPATRLAARCIQRDMSIVHDVVMTSAIFRSPAAMRALDVSSTSILLREVDSRREIERWFDWGMNASGWLTAFMTSTKPTLRGLVARYEELRRSSCCGCG